MRTSIFTKSLVFVCLLATGCTRENEIAVPEEAPIGGPGGKSTLKVVARHHGKNLNDATVYIEYNTLDMPADKVYDSMAVTQPEDGKPVATFGNLKRGNYYLYAKAYDADIDDTVTGGGPFTIIDTTGVTYNIMLDISGHSVIHSK